MKRSLGFYVICNINLVMIVFNFIAWWFVQTITPLIFMMIFITLFTYFNEKRDREYLFGKLR